jgi:hypothetical protein
LVRSGLAGGTQEKPYQSIGYLALARLPARGMDPCRHPNIESRTESVFLVKWSGVDMVQAQGQELLAVVMSWSIAKETNQRRILEGPLKSPKA